MTRYNRTADLFAACLRHTLPGGAIALLFAACLAVLPRPVGAVEAGVQTIAEESQSDKDADTDKTGTHQDKESDESGDKDEGGDKKRKSYQGSTEPSY